MGSSSFICTAIAFLAQFFILCFSQPQTEYVYPNFSSSEIGFVDQSGTFLVSRNGTFKASMYSPAPDENQIYLCVIHSASNAIIWSASRDSPVSNSGKMNLTLTAITIYDGNGTLLWSTPPLKSFVSALRLTEEGNLVLLDRNNLSLWQSFDHPTDTIVIGQRLSVGTFLNSSVSDTDLSTGDYSFLVTQSDAVLQWDGFIYQQLSMKLNAFRESNHLVEYMAMNSTGLYLFADNGSVVVLEVSLPLADFRTAKLDASGQFIISTYVGNINKREFLDPSDKCNIPLVCGRIGLCTGSTSTPISHACSCPSDLHPDSHNTDGCAPSNSSLSLAVACNATNKGGSVDGRRITYLGLGSGNRYLGETSSLDSVSVNLSTCQHLCSSNCSCLGFLYGNSTGSCSLLGNQLGSLVSGAGGSSLGYIKAVASLSSRSPGSSGSGGTNNRRELILIVTLVIFPSASLLLLLGLGVVWWKRRSISKVRLDEFRMRTSTSSGELEAFAIPGLPMRYGYEELKDATDDFSTQIGSGGFGTVYKGVLPDNTTVAVKKIANSSSRGKREFCTEIAVIGNVRHVNLVKLKGFCAQGSERLLVYEYMNRGSLDRTLFGTGPALEWQQRFDIVLGTARGLAYLHTGCEHKIIHCDVKPENILLHDHFQAKISDFGLSKLLSPEQSSHFTTMRGTRGYLAPEWLTRAAITEKTDVYSFGMVVLEIISGKKNCSFQTRSRVICNNGDSDNAAYNSPSSSPSVPVYFPMLALEKHEQGRYLELPDPRLEGRVTSEEVERLVRVALCCVHEEPSFRPSMVDVVGMLEGRLSLAQPRLEALNFLRFYGHRFAEASMMEEGNGQSNLLFYQQVNRLLHPGPNSDSKYQSGSQWISGAR